MNVETPNLDDMCTKLIFIDCNIEVHVRKKQKWFTTKKQTLRKFSFLEERIITVLCVKMQ